MESSPMCRKGEEKVQLQNRLTAITFPSLCVALLDARQKLWCSSLFLWSSVASWAISEFKHLQQSDNTNHLHPSQKLHLSQHSQPGCPCGHKKEQCDWGELIPGHIYGRISVPSWQWEITQLLQMRQEFLAWGMDVWGVLWKIPSSGCIQQKLVLTCGTGWD